MKKPLLTGFIKWLLIATVSWPVFVYAAEFVVKDIRVEGLQRISAGTVFNYLPVKIGDTIEAEDTPEIIRALFKTGFFKDVKLEHENGVLVIFVQERPAISDITIKGNKSIETEDLLKGLKEIGLAEGRTFNRSVLDRIEQELRRQFFSEGKYAVELTSTVTPLERNRVAIQINIKEGKSAKIKTINIVGNKAFEEEVLLEQFQLGSPEWWNFFSDSDQYSRQKLAADMESLRTYYLNRGYINFKIDSTQVTISPDKKDIYVTINIVEGEVYSISDIKLAGDFILPKEELFPLIHLTRGAVFSRKQTVESSDRINKKLADFGYAFANVNSIPDINEEDKTVGVTFFVDPGKRVYVRRINITGNERTRDQVLRREIRQMESGWYASEKVKQSRERLQRLGYFDDVSIETPAVPGSADQVDIDLKVKEKSSGAFLAGIGFSQSQGVVFNTSIVEKNFFGTGKQVSLAFDNSDVNTHYQVSYLNPYYTLDGVSRGFNFDYRQTDFSELDTADYLTDTLTLGGSFGIPTNEFDRIRLTADVRSTDFKINTTASNEIKNFVNVNGDSFLDFLLGVSWSHDSRDSALFPTRGGRQSIAAEATIPGSDLTYYKVSYRNRHYFPLSKAFTFSLNADLVFGDSYGDTPQLPFFENSFAGGSRTVRGYESNSLGPRDSLNDPLGGNLKIVGNAELLFPPPIDSFKDTARLGLFFDIGNVFDTSVADPAFDDLRTSVGLSASWLSPIGSLTFSFAQPLNEESTDDTEIFQFNLGTTF
ncbi:MAG: outer membrane protein assembly factor BamA [Chromatiales bacterium]|jgi:outer membrane protein insertion porin family